MEDLKTAYAVALATLNAAQEEYNDRALAYPEPAEDASDAAWDAWDAATETLYAHLNIDALSRALRRAEDALIDAMTAAIKEECADAPGLAQGLYGIEEGRKRLKYRPDVVRLALRFDFAA